MPIHIALTARQILYLVIALGVLYQEIKDKDDQANLVDLVEKITVKRR